MALRIGYHYDNLIEFAKKYGCKILDSKEKIDGLPLLINIEGRCGHNSAVTYNQLLKHKNIYCLECMKKIKTSPETFLIKCNNEKCKKEFIPSVSNFISCSRFCANSRKQTQETKDKIKSTFNKTQQIKISTNSVSSSCDLHTSGNQYMSNLLKKDINFYLTNRNSYYNMSLKPKIIQNNRWMPVEFKYSNTKEKDNIYFTMRQEYNNVIIICAYIELKIFWIFPLNFIKTTTRMKINIKTKFCDFLVEESQISDKLIEYYNKYEEILTIDKDGKSASDKVDLHLYLEYKYITLRIETIQFINFVKPISNFQTHNFLINDYKIQESVAYQIKNNQLGDLLVSTHKHVNGKSVPFDIGDNDFYWFNEPNENIFYVIPVSIMHSYGYIRTHLQIGKVKLNITQCQEWLSQYIFYYNTINEEINKQKLLKLFNL